jgi:hypothetical protein
VIFAVGPPWLRLSVKIEGDLVRRLKPFFDTAGGEPASEDAAPGLTVAEAEEIPGSERREFRLEGDVYRADAPEGRGRYNLTERRGDVVLTPRSGPYFETFLRQIFLLESYRRGGLVLHSVAFAEGRDAIVSCGVSESGKSTLAGLLRERFTVYSDEMNVVAGDGRVWSLPFRGTGVERLNAGGGLLRSLTFHRPGEGFTAELLKPAETVRELWPNVFVPEGADALVRELAFGRTADVAGQTRAFEVTVPLEEGAACEGFRDIIKETISAKDWDDEK